MSHKNICDECSYSRREIRYNHRYKKHEEWYMCWKNYRYIKLIKDKCKDFRDKSVPDIGKMIRKEGYQKFGDVN